MMLSNTLSIIEIVIQNKLNKKVDKDNLINFFKRYRKNMWLYPGVIKRKYSLSIAETYDFLNELEKQGVLQSYYELYCSSCQKSMGTIRLFNELPETFECELCNEELQTLKNSFLIYKVIRDD